jgi:hypothetical protein
MSSALEGQYDLVMGGSKGEHLGGQSGVSKLYETDYLSGKGRTAYDIASPAASTGVGQLTTIKGKASAL